MRLKADSFQSTPDLTAMRLKCLRAQDQIASHPLDPQPAAVIVAPA
jgi:hypothetical protein